MFSGGVGSFHALKEWAEAVQMIKTSCSFPFEYSISRW